MPYQFNNGCVLVVYQVTTRQTLKMSSTRINARMDTSENGLSLGRCEWSERHQICVGEMSIFNCSTGF